MEMIDKYILISNFRIMIDENNHVFVIWYASVKFKRGDNPLFMKDAPPGTIHVCHQFGWLFIYSKVRTFLVRVNLATTLPVRLILNGHACHIRKIKVLNLARENYVRLLLMPPHSNHYIQPFDKKIICSLIKYLTEKTLKQVCSVINNFRAIVIYPI